MSVVKKNKDSSLPLFTLEILTKKVIINDSFALGKRERQSVKLLSNEPLSRLCILKNSPHTLLAEYGLFAQLF